MRKSKSGSTYPSGWNKIAEDVKKEAGWHCVRCGAPNKPPTILTVHHLDMNPSNCRWWNLPALCQKCHLSIQAKVVLERVWMFDHSEWFKPYVAGYTAHRLGLPDDKKYVYAHLEELLEKAK